MPRYFFHVRDGEDHPDLQGTELRDVAAARSEAARFAGALLQEQPATFWSTGEWTMRVTDDRDLTLFELMFMVTESPTISQGKP